MEHEKHEHHNGKMVEGIRDVIISKNGQMLNLNFTSCDSFPTKKSDGVLRHKNLKKPFKFQYDFVTVT
jgi:hypothetical protein